MRTGSRRLPVLHRGACAVRSCALVHGAAFGAGAAVIDASLLLRPAATVTAKRRALPPAKRTLAPETSNYVYQPVATASAASAAAAAVRRRQRTSRGAPYLEAPISLQLLRCAHAVEPFPCQACCPHG